MPCTEAYREHIMYTFNGYYKTVIRFAAINAWRDRSRRRQKEISLEYLTEEKFYPLGTTDEYFEAPYEEYPITICGQTVILTNGKYRWEAPMESGSYPGSPECRHFYMEGSRTVLDQSDKNLSDWL